jgi:hypothetical protein
MDELLDLLDDSIARHCLYEALLQSEITVEDENQLCSALAEFAIDNGLNSHECMHLFGLAFLRFVHFFNKQKSGEAN